MSSIDRFPQTMTLTGLQTAIDDYFVTTFALPMSRISTAVGTTMAMEILQVNWYINLADAADNTSNNWAFLTSATARTSGLTSTALTADQDARQARTFAMAFATTTTTTSGVKDQVWPISINMSDGAGNGFLYVGDTLTMVQGNSAGAATTGSTTAKILYRWVRARTDELFGVLQAQQAVVS